MSSTLPNSVLRGHPRSSFSEEQLVRYVPDADERLKVSRGHCYEHFERTNEHVVHDGRELRVFSWTHRTYVAE